MDFSIDWLEVTVWASADEVKGVIRTSLFEYFDVPGWPGGWRGLGPAKRIIERYEAIEGFEVLDYDAEYVGVRLKGGACQKLGDAAINALLGCLQPWRCKATRIDLAWDGFPLTPKEVDGLLREESYSSRAQFDPWLQESKHTTLYSHETPMRRDISRWFRVYDRRGPVRFEWVIRHLHATTFVLELLNRPVSEWCDFSVSALRGFVDFLDPDHQVKNKGERRLHPSWRVFVRSTPRWKPDALTVLKRDKAAEEVLAWHDERIRRLVPLLREHVEAFGFKFLEDWILSFPGEEINWSRVCLLKRGLEGRIRINPAAGMVLS